MDNYVARAKDLAHRAHAGQVDKAGRPYIEHVARVAAACADDPLAEAVAWAHDIIEDCPNHLGEAIALPDDVYDRAYDLTRYTAGSDEAYYSRIRKDPVALRVKLADIADNADESRLALLDEKTAARLRRKYAKAREALTGGRDGK